VQHSLVLLCVLERLSTAAPQKQISERQSVLTIPQSNWCTISVRMNILKEIGLGDSMDQEDSRGRAVKCI
jgi:hypothetical protein